MKKITFSFFSFFPVFYANHKQGGILWNAMGFEAGVYFYRLQAGEYMETKKLFLNK